MEKNWVVEVWGDWTSLGAQTELFYTRREALEYFKSLRRKLDSSQYIFTQDSIVEIANEVNSIVLTDLRELL